MSFKISFDDGLCWNISTRIADEKAFNEAPVIGIPVDQMGALSAEQIGKRVLELTGMAEVCRAVDFAREITSNRDYYKHTPHALLLEWSTTLLPLLEKHLATEEADHRESITEAYVLLTRLLKPILNRPKPEEIKAERRVVAANYSDLFLLIGKRDGFKCAACGCLENLQLDHVVPVTWGGKSVADNLQLLCASCNVRKGASDTDYRQTKGEDTIQ